MGVLHEVLSLPVAADKVPHCQSAETHSVDGTEGTCTQHSLSQLRNNEKEHQLYSVQLYIYMYTTSSQIVQVIYMIVHLHLKLYMYTYTCTCALGVRCCFAFVCFFLSSFLSLIQNIHKSFTYCTVNIQYILYVYIYSIRQKNLSIPLEINAV